MIIISIQSFKSLAPSINSSIILGLYPSGLFNSSSTMNDYKIVSLANPKTDMNIMPIINPSRPPTTTGAIQFCVRP